MRDLNQDIWALAVPGKKTVLGRGRIAGMQAFEKVLIANEKIKPGEFRGLSVVTEFVEGSLDNVYLDGNRLDIVEIPK